MGHDDEAKLLYDSGRGKFFVSSDAFLPEYQIWEEAIIDDFKELRSAGLFRPLMTKVEDEYNQYLERRKGLTADVKLGDDYLYGQKYYTHALDAYKKAAKIVVSNLLSDPQNLQYQRDACEVYYVIGKAYFQLNDLTSAETTFRESISIIDKALIGDDDDEFWYREVVKNLLDLSYFAEDKHALLLRAESAVAKLKQIAPDRIRGRR